MITRWQEVFKKAQPAVYNAEKGRGVPAPVTWRHTEIWPFNGETHCSGAVWWAVVTLLREYTDLETELDFEQIEALRRAAWVLDGVRGGLPLLLGSWGLGTYFQGLPSQGDICQIWRGPKSGHLIICAGYDEDGTMLEWSASATHPQGTGIKPFVGSPKEVHSFRFDEGFFR